MDNNNYEQPSYYQQPEPTWNNDAPEGQEGKGLATASLVTGIIGVICCTPCAIAAIILSIVSKSKGNKSGIATAGLVLGIVGIAIWIINIILYATGVFDYSFLTDMIN